MVAFCNEHSMHTNTTGLVDYPGSTEDRYEGYSDRPYHVELNCIMQSNNRRRPFDMFSQSLSGSAVYVMQLANTGDILFSWNENVRNRRRHSLSAYLGAWKGDDINEMLDMVHKTRSKI